MNNIKNLKKFIFAALFTVLMRNSVLIQPPTQAATQADKIKFLLLQGMGWKLSYSHQINVNMKRYRKVVEEQIKDSGHVIIVQEDLNPSIFSDYKIDNNTFFNRYPQLSMKTEGLKAVRKIGESAAVDYIVVIRTEWDDSKNALICYFINRWSGKVFIQKISRPLTTWPPRPFLSGRVRNLTEKIVESAKTDMMIVLNERRKILGLPPLIASEDNMNDNDMSIQKTNYTLKEKMLTSPLIRNLPLPKSLYIKQNFDSIAVVIGNQNYSHKDIPSVQFAHNDSFLIKRFLIDTLGYKDGNIIFEKNTSKAELEKIFGTKENYRGLLFNYIKPQKSDVFIYYSGHGAPDPTTNQAYLIPNDCDPLMISLTAYPLNVLYGNLPKIEANSITVVIDACFSGGTNSGKWLVPNASPALIKVKNPITTQDNITVFTSARNNQVSSWYPEKRHSMFTYFFLKAIFGDADFNKDKQITFEEIYEFVSDRAEGVPYYAKRLHGGRTQIPTMITANKHAVFVRY